MKAYFEGDKDVFVFKPIPKAKRGRPKKDVTDINVGDKTNADHIRSMTDEELAKFLLEIMSNSVCFGEGMFPYHPCPQEQDCEKCGLGWLKQPYKEAPNDPT
jgi:hypothetical protein